MFSMTYLPWLTKKTKADFRIEFYQRGNLFFRGKTRLVLRGEGAVKRLLVKKVKKNLVYNALFPPDDCIIMELQCIGLLSYLTYF